MPLTLVLEACDGSGLDLSYDYLLDWSLGTPLPGGIVFGFVDLEVEKPQPAHTWYDRTSKGQQWTEVRRG